MALGAALPAWWPLLPLTPRINGTLHRNPKGVQGNAAALVALCLATFLLLLPDESLLDVTYRLPVCSDEPHSPHRFSPEGGPQRAKADSTGAHPRRKPQYLL